MQGKLLRAVAAGLLAVCLAAVATARGQTPRDPLAEVQSEVARARAKAPPDNRALAAALVRLAERQDAAGWTKEAAASLAEALALQETAFGRDHATTAQTRDRLALLNGRLVKSAETLIERAEAQKGRSEWSEAAASLAEALGLQEIALGPADRVASNTRNNLALLYRDRLAKLAETEALMLNALALYDKDPGFDVNAKILSLRILIGLNRRHFRRFDVAEQYLEALLTLCEQRLGPDHPETTQSTVDKALFLRDLGRYWLAEPLLKRALAQYDRTTSRDWTKIVIALQNLIGLLRLQNRLEDALPHMERIVKIEGELRPREEGHVNALTSLALVNRDLRNYDKSRQWLDEAIEIERRRSGGSSVQLAFALDVRAGLEALTGRKEASLASIQESLDIRRRLQGPKHPDTADALRYLALAHQRVGDHDKAMAVLAEARAVLSERFGADNLRTLENDEVVGRVLVARGRLDEAEQAFQRVARLRTSQLGADHPATADVIHELGQIALRRSDWPAALRHFEQSQRILINRKHAQAATHDVLSGSDASDTPLKQNRSRFIDYVRALHFAKGGDAAAKAFEAAQWALLTDAARALAFMAARFNPTDSRLGDQIRELQDLEAAWRDRDRRLVRSLSAPDTAPARADRAALRQELAAIEGRIGSVRQAMNTAFSDYVALANPQPLSLGDAQALLRDDEALVLFLDTEQATYAAGETFVWAIARTASRLVRAELGTGRLDVEVSALRCGLDDTTWDERGEDFCQELTGSQLTRSQIARGAPLPFNHARAHALYRQLFGEIGDVIAGRKLVLVPSGALTRLPFQVLVAEPPAGDDHQRIAWLAKTHAITVLPAVSSLQALRRVAEASKAPKPMIGFGNPLLKGDPLERHHRQLAAAAEERVGCAAPGRRVSAGHRGRRSLVPLPQQDGRVDLEAIRMQLPLPETADELCAVARDVGADVADVRLGRRATESEVKALSQSGALAQFKIVHFATHGLLAGQLSGTAEPGLILSPPRAATGEDDGYLAASEIAALRLDADWVILSACNTAGGAGSGEAAEALSGLARAFFYAHARALLVSHWAVESKAAVDIITSALRETTQGDKAGRAEALRRAMLRQIAAGGEAAHPSYWGPFVVVGEGGVLKR